MGLVTSLVVLAAAAGGAVAIVRHDHDSSPSARGPIDSRSFPPIAPGSVVHVETDVRTTRFLPLGPAPVDGRTLSAQHAYNAMLGSSSLSAPIPAEIHAYYGTLTDSSTSPMAIHLRVWGFAVRSGCVYTFVLPSAGQPTPSRPSRCRKWEFVNARTGRDLGVISQEVLPD